MKLLTPSLYKVRIQSGGKPELDRWYKDMIGLELNVYLIENESWGVPDKINDNFGKHVYTTSYDKLPEDVIVELRKEYNNNVPWMIWYIDVADCCIIKTEAIDIASPPYTNNQMLVYSAIEISLKQKNHNKELLQNKKYFLLDYTHGDDHCDTDVVCASDVYSAINILREYRGLKLSDVVFEVDEFDSIIGLNK